MIRAVRAAVRALVATLALAVAFAPVVLDGCLMTCRGITATSSRTTRAEHACHHAASGLNVLHQFGDDSRSCNHEHGQTASLYDATRSGTPLKSMPLVIIGLALTPAAPGINTHVESPPSRASLVLQHSTDLVRPLRI
jgi:hypothetical protein